MCFIYSQRRLAICKWGDIFAFLMRLDSWYLSCTPDRFNQNQTISISFFSLGNGISIQTKVPLSLLLDQSELCKWHIKQYRLKAAWLSRPTGSQSRQIKLSDLCRCIILFKWAHCMYVCCAYASTINPFSKPISLIFITTKTHINSLENMRCTTVN